ncbi:MAG: class I SAM-dependent methyltransferase [Marivita sp.]|uniref:class I SAM-dependent methyltransferase n=1 Tax=Marivita sp. TaxID=2003365 RepID=UPI0025B91ED1|nr:class I SAM-dependent methyltransferase [Marivita sp.]MCI5110764.1 class I SAM-dependent methyltransferase [Marivita sp.]
MTKDYISVNRGVWNADAKNWVALGERLWAGAPHWGIWGLPEADLGLFPADLAGCDAVELGCGTGYVSGWMARRGACVTGLDLSAEQLATARRLAGQHGAEITFLEADAEATGLPDAAFDFAISEYGAAIWCRPGIWLREAWRLLRPGGGLVFLGNHPLSLICTPQNGAPCEAVLHRPYRGMWGGDWTEVEIDPSGVTFNLTMADWMALFREIGFEIVNYLELYAPEEASQAQPFVPLDWAKAYPSEQVWVLRKPA